MRSLLCGVLVVVSCLFAEATFAADFAKNARYLVLVNGMQVPKEESDGSETWVATLEEYRTHKLTAKLANHPISREVQAKVATLGETPFAIAFRTNARGEIQSGLVYTQNEEWSYGATGEEATRKLAGASPMPRPRPPANPAPAQDAPRRELEKPAPQAVAAPVPAGPPAKRYYVVINRTATAEEKAAGLQLIQASYAEFLETKFPDPHRQALLEQVRAEVARLGWRETPFTIEWAETKEQMLTGELVLRTADQTFRLNSPQTPAVEEKLEDPETTLAAQVGDVTLESLVASLSLEEKPSAYALKRDAILWAVGAKAAHLACTAEGETLTFTNPEVAQVFNAAELNTKAGVASPALDGALSEIVGSLNRARRFTVFLRKGGGDHCLKPLFERIWAKLLQDRQNFLVWDFKHWLEEVAQNRDHLEFVGTEHEYRITDSGVADRLRVLQALLSTIESRHFSSGLPRTFKEWATHDTNTPDVNTRKEPIDILAYYIGSQLEAEIATESQFGTVGRQTVVKAALQHVLMPERFGPKIVVSKMTEAKANELGGPAFALYCAGGPLALANVENFRPKRTTLVHSIRILESELRDLRAAKQQMRFQCGSLGASLSVPAEKLNVELNSPSSHQFRYGEDKTIKAVTTFPLVNEASASFVEGMKAGTALAGYRMVSHDKSTNLKKEFLAELADSDFYFPAAHQTNGATFGIGYENGSKMTLERSYGDKGRVVIVAFLPPHGGRNAGVELRDTEISEFFKHRRGQQVQRRFTVMNVACGSAACVPHWMRAYRMSLDGTKFSLADAEKLQGEVPVVIGASRSFATNDVRALLAHSQFPIRTLDIAGNEQSLPELLRYLGGTDFGPVSNIEDRTHFSVEAQNQKVTVLIQTATGERIVN